MEWDAREKLRTRLEEVVRKVLGRADDNFIFSLLCNIEIVEILRRKSPKREMEEQLERLILRADAEERDRFFEKTIQSIQMLTTSRNESSVTSSEVMIAAANLRKLCEQPDILKEFVHKVKVSCPGLEKEVPDFEKALDALIHIPINRLKSPKEVLTFLDDLIQSGGASQSEQGLVFVLGNTNAGKTSLVDTFVGYAADPSQKKQISENKFQVAIMSIMQPLPCSWRALEYSLCALTAQSCHPACLGTSTTLALAPTLTLLLRLQH